MNYKQKGDGIEGRHCQPLPSSPALANEGWDPGWPWDLMPDFGWWMVGKGDMSLLEGGVRGGWVGTEEVVYCQ